MDRREQTSVPSRTGDQKPKRSLRFWQRWGKTITDEVGVSYAYLSPIEVLRIRFWSVITGYAEARWLEANGWRRTRDGWLLPDWHPHKRQARAEKEGLRRFDYDRETHKREIRKEPYTQNHAVNSQSAHLERGTVQSRNKAGHKAPPFPSHRWHPYAATVTVLSFLVTTTAFTFNTRQIHGAFVLASALLVCVSFFISHKARRAFELDWAESQLMRRTLHESTQIHDSN